MIKECHGCLHLKNTMFPDMASKLQQEIFNQERAFPTTSTRVELGETSARE